MHADTELLAAILIVLVASVWRAERRHADVLDVAHFVAEEMGDWFKSWRDARDGDGDA